MPTRQITLDSERQVRDRGFSRFSDLEVGDRFIFYPAQGIARISILVKTSPDAYQILGTDQSFEVHDHHALVLSITFAGPLTSGHDPLIDQAIEVLQTGSRRQDGTDNQLTDVLALATAAGCFDAIDRIRGALGSD